MAYIAIVAQDFNTSEVQMIVTQPTKPIFDAKGMVPNDTIIHMVRKYIAMNTQFDERQMFHFINWCASFQGLSKKLKKSSKISVDMYQLDTKEQVKAFEQNFHKHYSKAAAE